MSNTQTNSAQSANGYDYSNAGMPRDFDIRIEVAEQQEIIHQSQERLTDSRWHCSEYDF